MGDAERYDLGYIHAWRNGTDKIDGLNLLNMAGVTITTLEIFAYGTIGDDTFVSSCADNTSLFTACTFPGSQAKNTTISINHPIEWTFTGGTWTDSSTELRLVDNSTGTDTDLFYEIEINGAPPSGAVPEPTSVILLASVIGLAGLARKRFSAVRSSGSHSR